MPSLSRDWTAERMMEHALSVVGSDKNSIAWTQRFELIGQAESAVSSLFYDVMSNAYMTPITILPDTTGRYSSVGTGTWTAATGLLTFVGMNTDFGSGDVGKTITFRVGALVYIGQIATFIDIDNVTVEGHNLPATNQTVDYVLVSSNTPTGNSISLVGLRLMRTAAVKMVLESTATENVVPVSEEELTSWQAGAPKNSSRIAWAYAGELIKLRRGSALTTYGTFTLSYPRVPYVIAADSDFIDLPDGAPIDIALIKLERLVASRLRFEKPLPDRSDELRFMIESLYRSANREFSFEIVKSKIQALQ